jgi:hypothetical protein
VFFFFFAFCFDFFFSVKAESSSGATPLSDAMIEDHADVLAVLSLRGAVSTDLKALDFTNIADLEALPLSLLECRGLRSIKFREDQLSTIPASVKAGGWPAIKVYLRGIKDSGKVPWVKSKASSVYTVFAFTS